MVYTYEYPRPMVTTDILVFNKTPENTSLLLIKRLHNPFYNHWALPGGFVDENESLLHAAERELMEETGLHGIALEQFHAFGDPGRDPRGHCISIVFAAILSHTKMVIRAGDDAKDAQWFNIDALPPLAFDHHQIIEKALQRYF